VSIRITPAHAPGYRAPPPGASGFRPAGDLSRPGGKSYDASVRGAVITIRCDCGGVGYVPYDVRWECPSCHRRWNTGQIPAEEYWAIMRDMRRMRINVLATALGIVVPIVALSVVLGFRMLLLLPVVMSFWFLFYMPRWRRRVRQRARSLTSWQLHPE
jgi:hypothetical protein